MKLLIFAATVALLLLMLAPADAARKPFTPTFFIEHGYEPVIPGMNYTISGCGYQPGLPVHVIDSIIYSDEYPVGGFTIPFDNLPLGELEQIELVLETNASGCILPATYGYQGWGIGRHVMTVYQTVTRRGPKVLTTVAVDEYVHNAGEMVSQYACMYYDRTPPGPLVHYSCPDTDGDWRSDFSEAYWGTDPLVGCAADTVPDNESGLDAWPIDFNDDQVSNLADGAAFSKFTKTPIYKGDPEFDRRFDLDMNGMIVTQSIHGWGETNDLLHATMSNSSCIH